MIGDYLHQTVGIRRRTGSDADGQAVYAGPVSVPARVQQRKRMIRDDRGEMVVSDAQVFLRPGVQVDEGDRITYGALTYHVMSVTDEYALDELSHVVAWTGRVGSGGS